jgi:hypothetical protein
VTRKNDQLWSRQPPLVPPSITGRAIGALRDRASVNQMSLNTSGDGRHSKALRAWQLALLRFAITMDNADRLALLAIAAELDSPGSRPSARPAFRFFYNASAELCHAIINPHLAASAALLQRHLTRCDDERLKRALAAALAIDIPQAKPPTRPLKPNSDLWRGLSRRSVSPGTTQRPAVRGTG